MSNTPVKDNYSGKKLHSDDEIVIPPDDLYFLSWEVDFDNELFETRKDNWPDTAARGVDFYVTDNERNSVNEDERSSEKRNEMMSTRMK